MSARALTSAVVRRVGGPWLLWLALAAGGVAVLGHERGRFGFYADEGINLLKAFMVANGHQLYTEIYSDQPPLFTWILALGIRVFGPDTSILRQISLFFGTAALLGGAAVAARLAGRGAAVLCVILLLVAAPFLKFATTVVITMPGLALAVWSLFFALRSATAWSRTDAAVSGVLLGLAAICKIAFFYFAPIVMTALALVSVDRPRVERGKAAGCWLVGVAIPVVAVMSIYPLRPMATQLIEPHVAALGAFGAQSAGARRAMLLAPGMVVMYLAAACGVVVLRHNGLRRESVVVALWLLVVGLWIVNHRPLWSHHLPDLVLPLAVAASAGVVACFRARGSLPGGRWSLLLLLPPALTALTAIRQATHHEYWRRWYDSSSEASLRQVAGAISAITTPSDWVVVDRPILAFWAQRRTPPQLAVMSVKRIETGGITDKLLLEALVRFSPRAVCLCTERLLRFRSFIRSLDLDYRELIGIEVPLGSGVKRGEVCRLFVRQFVPLQDERDSARDAQHDIR